MNILKTLFGLEKKGKSNSVSENVDLLDSLEPDHIPSKDLFIDNSSPEELHSSELIGKDPISIFLNENYYQIGVDEGFKLHSNEAAESRIKLIKSNFRNLLNQLIDQRQEEILSLRNSAVEIAEISKELKEKLENKIEFLEGKVNELEQQKILSSENEGLIMSAVHDYRQGYFSGVKSYLEMEKIISSTY